MLTVHLIKRWQLGPWHVGVVGQDRQLAIPNLRLTKAPDHIVLAQEPQRRSRNFTATKVTCQQDPAIVEAHLTVVGFGKFVKAKAYPILPSYPRLGDDRIRRGRRIMSLARSMLVAEGAQHCNVFTDDGLRRYFTSSERVALIVEIYGLGSVALRVATAGIPGTFLLPLTGPTRAVRLRNTAVVCARQR